MRAWTKNIVICLIFFAATVPRLSARASNADLERMLEAYRDIYDFYAEVTITVYQDATESRVITAQNAVLKRQGDKFLYTLDDMTVLLNDRCMVMVNDQERSIVYNARPEGFVLDQRYDLTAVDIDSLFQHCDSLQFAGQEGDRRHYVLYASRSLIERTDLFLDGDTNLISKLVYRYNAKQGIQDHVVVEYKNVDVHPVFLDIDFSEDKYVVASAAGMAPAAPYSRYRLIVIENEAVDTDEGY